MSGIERIERGLLSYYVAQCHCMFAVHFGIISCVPVTCFPVWETIRVHKSMDLGVNFLYSVHCVTLTIYLNFGALFFSPVKWAELFQSLSCDKIESHMSRVLHGSWPIVNAQQWQL